MDKGICQLHRYILHNHDMIFLFTVIIIIKCNARHFSAAISLLEITVNVFYYETSSQNKHSHFFIFPEIHSLCVSFPICSCHPLSHIYPFSGWDEFRTGLPGRRGLSERNAQWNRVPRGSAIPVHPPPGPLLLCNPHLLSLHAEHPRGLPPWLETRCSHCQLLRLGCFKVFIQLYSSISSNYLAIHLIL